MSDQGSVAAEVEVCQANGNDNPIRIADLTKVVSVITQAMSSATNLVFELQGEKADIRRRAQMMRMNPSLELEIQEINVGLQEYIAKAEGFIDSCTQLATYGTNPELARIIDEDLAEYKTENLQKFIDEIVIQLGNCKEWCKKLDESTEQKGEAKEKLQHLSKEKEAVKQNAEIARMKWYGAMNVRRAAQGLGYLSALGVSAALALRNANTISATSTTRAVIGSLASCAFFYIVQFPLNVVGESHRQKMVTLLAKQQHLENAQGRISDLLTKCKVVEVQIIHYKHKTEGAKPNTMLRKIEEPIHAEELSQQQIEESRSVKYTFLEYKAHLQALRSSLQKILDYRRNHPNPF